MNLVSVGKIIKPQGIRGEVKVFSYFDDTKTFCSLKKVRLSREDQFRFVESVRVQGDIAYLKLEGINTRNDAELLKYQELFVEREELAEIFDDKDLILLQDIIGYNLESAGTLMGKIISIENYGASDIIILSSNNQSIMLPIVDNIFEKIDIENKKVIVDNKIFNEVVVRNDED